MNSRLPVDVAVSPMFSVAHAMKDMGTRTSVLPGVGSIGVAETDGNDFVTVGVATLREEENTGVLATTETDERTTLPEKDRGCNAGPLRVRPFTGLSALCPWRKDASGTKWPTKMPYRARRIITIQLRMMTNFHLHRRCPQASLRFPFGPFGFCGPSACCCCCSFSASCFLKKASRTPGAGRSPGPKLGSAKNL